MRLLEATKAYGSQQDMGQLACEDLAGPDHFAVFTRPKYVQEAAISRHQM